MSSATKTPTPKMDGAAEKPRDDIVKSREAKKLKKQAKKGQGGQSSVQAQMATPESNKKPGSLPLKSTPVKSAPVKASPVSSSPTKSVPTKQSPTIQASPATSNLKDTQMKKEKSREEIRKETEALKSEKPGSQTPAAPVKPSLTKSSPIKPAPLKITTEASANIGSNAKIEKSREEILKEREAKKLAKQKGKQLKKEEGVSQQIPASPVGDPRQAKLLKALQKQDSDAELSEKLNHLHITEPIKETQSADINMTETVEITPEASKTVELLNMTENKAKPLTKAERRALQEAQRAAKADKLKTKDTGKPKETKETSKQVPVHAKKHTSPSPAKIIPTTTDKRATAGKSVLRRVKLFNHLYTEKCYFNTPINSDLIHPEIVRLGIQYSHGIIVGANARCIAFLNAMKAMIRDFATPLQKELTRELENLLKPVVSYLKQCRPLSVSMTNALRYIRWQLTHLNGDDSDEMKKEALLDAIDTYIRDQIEKAQQAISISVQEKITDGDVILTYGCSSLIKHILEAARERNVDFRVIIVDAFPRHEGQEMLKRLVAEGIECTCVLINAVGFMMPEVTKVLLGAHALLANGYVMSRVGTAQIALIAKSYNVPVLVCCETHKFSERVQTDAFVYNEIGDPDDLVLKSKNNSKDVKDPLANWENTPHLTPLNLCYDVTPPELVTAVVTEIAILPCTSVPVILRIKPSEIGY